MYMTWYIHHRPIYIYNHQSCWWKFNFGMFNSKTQSSGMFWDVLRPFWCVWESAFSSPPGKYVDRIYCNHQVRNTSPVICIYIYIWIIYIYTNSISPWHPYIPMLSPFLRGVHGLCHSWVAQAVSAVPSIGACWFWSLVPSWCCGSDMSFAVLSLKMAQNSTFCFSQRKTVLFFGRGNMFCLALFFSVKNLLFWRNHAYKMDKDQEQYARINPILGWVAVDRIGYINMDKNIYRYENAVIIPKMVRWAGFRVNKSIMFWFNVARQLNGVYTNKIKTYRHLFLVWQLMHPFIDMYMICIWIMNMAQAPCTPSPYESAHVRIFTCSQLVILGCDLPLGMVFVEARAWHFIEIGGGWLGWLNMAGRRQTLQLSLW